MLNIFIGITVTSGILFGGMFLLVWGISKLAHNDKWTKTPLKEWETELAIKYNVFDGNVEEIKNHIKDTREIINDIRQHAVNTKGNYFSYSLYSYDECVKFLSYKDCMAFIEILENYGIFYYSYHFTDEYSVKTTTEFPNYYICVKDEDFEIVQKLLDESNIDGLKYHYWEENVEEYYETKWSN